jgi:hypothetical protein
VGSVLTLLEAPQRLRRRGHPVHAPQGQWRDDAIVSVRGGLV